MNPAFESTVFQGAAAPGPAGPSARILQGAAAAMALLALPLSALPGVAPAMPLNEGALLCALASVLLLRWSAGAQRRQAAAEGLVDPVTGLYNMQGLESAGGQLLARARAEGRPVALAVLDFDDLLEVRSIYGREVHRKLLARVVRKVEAIAGSRGLAARTGKTRFCVLLPRMNRDQARVAIQRVLGKPGRIEFDAGDEEIVLVPDILAETAAAAAETVEELHREVAQSLQEQRARELRRQHWLQRERERHSRPMSLPAALDSRPPAIR